MPDRSTSRTRRIVSGAILIVFSLVVSGVVISALQAEGRTASRADTNDGGAWLVKRDLGYVGHVNRVVGEVTKAVNVASPQAVVDIDQARDVIVAHDSSANQISVIDDATGNVINQVAVPDGAVVRAVDEGAVVFTPESFTLWHMTIEQLTSETSLDEIDPAISGSGQGGARVLDGMIAAADGERVYRIDAVEGEGEVEVGPEHGMEDPIVDLTFVGGRTVLVDNDGDGVLVNGGSVDSIDLQKSGTAPALAQPQSGGDAVEFVTADGVLHRVALDGDARPEPIADLEGAKPLAPIVHGGCTFTVVTEPATFQKVCGGETHERTQLQGAGPELRLKLVNGWVWINDLETGAAWITDPDRPLSRVDDWDSVLNPRDEIDENKRQDDGGEEVTEENRDADDADVRRADELEHEGENRPPVAEDDEAGTRADREVLVDVLANDEDPDGDALRVNDAELSAAGTEEGHRVHATPDGTAVQFIPAPGFTGNAQFSYEIDDGRGGEDSANVDITVVEPNQNRPPEPQITVVATRAGNPASVNVLQNDSDPDGDAIYLHDITLDTELGHPGELVWDQSGRVVYTPDSEVNENRIELTYEVRDEYGEAATGTLRVLVRLADTNNEPDARHDQATTIVGRSVSIDVLENDYDPDGDPLSAQSLALVQPPGTELSSMEANLADDGEFTFRPEEARTYVFSYVSSDGELNDQALIRVDVSDPDENRPPVAVRDDVVIPRGGSRMVYVLDNDSDPDGDVVGLLSHSDVPGLRIEEIAGLGYLLRVGPDAPAQMDFTYTISDGFEDATAPVIVSVSDEGDADQPPVAVDDETDVRPGGTVSVPVLENDFDPKGGALEVVGATSNESAGVEAEPSGDGDMVDITVSPSSDGGEVTYDIVDEVGNSVGARIQVRIVPPDQENRPPIARRDVARTQADRAVQIPVLSNDTDPDGDAITIDAVAEQPGNGAATGVGDGVIEYVPIDGFTGTDRFTYSVVDEFGARSTGEVLVGVMPAVDNRAPQAEDDEFEVVAGPESAVLAVLDNDVDPDGDELTVIEATDSSLGEVEINGDGDAITFRPPPELDEPTQTSFSYEVSDGVGGRARATVVVNVLDEPLAQPPVANNIVTDHVAAGGEVVVDVLDHVTDPDTPIDQLEISVDDPALEVNEDDQIVVTAGEESSRHTYEVTDPDGQSDRANITVIVVDNQPPVFEPMEFETTAGEPVTMRLAQYVDDPDGDPMFFGCCTGRGGGGTTVDRKGENQLVVTFTPNDGFTGQGGFTISADDQMGRPVDGRVTINVTASNRPPEATNTTADVPAGGSTTVGLGQLASDPDQGDSLSFEIDGPANGNVSVSRDGPQVTIEAPADAGGSTDLVTYTATDREGETATGNINIAVGEPDAAPPQAVADTADGRQGDTVTIPVLGNDIDPLGEGLSISAVGGTDAGNTAPAGDGAVTFTSHDDFSGTASFTYTISDAADREATGQVTVEIIGRPSAPPRPSADAAAGQATVTWGTPSGNGAQITGYQIRLNGGEIRDVGVQNSATLAGLTNGQEYTFEVRGINEAGEGDWSPPSNTVMPDVRPGRPAAPTVEYRDSALQVTWSAPSNEGSPIQGYDLRISGGANESISLGDRTSYVWEGLQNGTTYTFAVRAKNLHPDPGDWSADSAPEHPNREPDAPNAPVAERGDGSLRVCWDSPPNGGDPVTQYQLEMRSNGQTATTDATCYIWHNLPQGEFQQFRVQARNRAGWGGWSGWSNEEKPCRQPDAPAAPSAQRGDQQATINWQAPNDQGCQITQYEIQDQNDNTHSGVSPSARQYTYGNLTNGNEYRFRVRAVNEEGAGGWSTYSNPVVPAGPPRAPTITSAEPGVGQVKVSWTRPDDNGSSITNFQLWVNGSPRNVGNVTSHTVTGLSPSTSYRFQVAAQNDVGVGPQSNEMSATTHGPPGQVRNLSASASDRTVRVSWSAPSSDGGASIRGYKVVVNGGSPRTTSSTSYSFQGSYGNSYNISVRAYNAVGDGPSSSTSASVKDPTSITISKGRNAQGQPGCSSSYCRFVHLEARGLSSNQSYSSRCWSEERGAWGNGGGITTNGSGNFSGDLACYFGYPGDRVYVEVGGRRSNTVTW